MTLGVWPFHGRLRVAAEQKRRYRSRGLHRDLFLYLLLSRSAPDRAWLNDEAVAARGYLFAATPYFAFTCSAMASVTRPCPVNRCFTQCVSFAQCVHVICVFNTRLGLPRSFFNAYKTLGKRLIGNF